MFLARHRHEEGAETEQTCSESDVVSLLSAIMMPQEVLLLPFLAPNLLTFVNGKLWVKGAWLRGHQVSCIVAGPCIPACIDALIIALPGPKFFLHEKSLSRYGAKLRFTSENMRDKAKGRKQRGRKKERERELGSGGVPEEKAQKKPQGCPAIL